MRFLLCALVLAAFAGPGQASSASPPEVAAPVKQMASNRTDGQILTAIRAKLAKSKVASERFTVTVQNGVATIDGKTSVMQHKGVATRIARSSGAVAVRNRIQIADDAKAKAVARLKKTDITPTPSQQGQALMRQPARHKPPNTAATPVPPALARATVIPPAQ